MPRLSNAREEILRSASTLFWFSSYEAVGVEAICREAGVKKGSFYHFFPSKEDVAYCMLEKIQREGEARLLTPCFDAGIPPAERFSRFLELLEQHVAAERSKHGGEPYPGCPIGNLVLELSTQSERLRQKLAEIIASFVEVFARALEDAKRSGRIDPGIDAMRQAELFAAAWQGGILIAKAYNRPEMCVRVLRQVIEGTFGAIPSEATRT